MTEPKRILAAAIAAIALLTPAKSETADPFYKGKTLNLIVGYEAGGGSDITCRLFANYLPKFVGGAPTVIVRNMPGGGGLQAMNYVGEAAKPDGMTAICGAFNTLVQLLDDKALRVDLSKFNFISGIPDHQVFYVRADVKPGIKKTEDIFIAEGLILGGLRSNSLKDLLVRPALDLLGVKYKYVTGVAGDGAGRKHIQTGFLNAWQEGMGSYISVAQGTLIAPGIAVPIFQMGGPDANGKLTKRNAAIPNIPTFYEVYKAKFGKEPAGKVWDVYAVMAIQTAAALRAFALPPGAPKQAIAELRAGMAAMLKDDNFWVDAKKSMGDTVEFTSGEGTQKAFDGALNATPDLKQFLLAYIKEGEEAARTR